MEKPKPNINDRKLTLKKLPHEYMIEGCIWILLDTYVRKRRKAMVCVVPCKAQPFIERNCIFQLGQVVLTTSLQLYVHEAYRHRSKVLGT